MTVTVRVRNHKNKDRLEYLLAKVEPGGDCSGCGHSVESHIAAASAGVPCVGCVCDGYNPETPSQCRRCSECIGEDHHWLEDLDEEGAPIFARKHCPATKPWEDDLG